MEVVKSEIWKCYVNFGNGYHMDPAPITPDTVCQFLVHLGESLKYSTINECVS